MPYSGANYFILYCFNQLIHFYEFQFFDELEVTEHFMFVKTESQSDCWLDFFSVEDFVAICCFVGA